MKQDQVIVFDAENLTAHAVRSCHIAPKNNPMPQKSAKAMRTAQNTENHPIMQRIFRLSWIKIRKTAILSSNPDPEPDRKSP